MILCVLYLYIYKYSVNWILIYCFFFTFQCCLMKIMLVIIHTVLNARHYLLHRVAHAFNVLIAGYTL